MATAARVVVDGTVRPGFEAVREAFVENFTSRGEFGAACCVYQDGERVVDLWGGMRDRTSGVPWRPDTMAVVHSATKGLAAMVLALARSRGWLDYDQRVCTYWPEFAQAGKDRVTVRQLLAHQAGLFAFDERVDRAVVADLDRLAEVMARQRPAWPPGERQAYHAISLGFYEGELQRVVVRDLEVPSGGGVGTARAIAKAYGVFAGGGGELGLAPETVDALMAPAVPSRHGFYDECFKGPARFSLGFMKPSESVPFGHAGAFGAPGAGGAMGYADPEAGIGYGYVTNRMGTQLDGDPRDLALRAAIPGATCPA